MQITAEIMQTHDFFQKIMLHRSQRAPLYVKFLLITRYKVLFKNTCETKKGREIENQKRTARAQKVANAMSRVGLSTPPFVIRKLSKQKVLLQTAPYRVCVCGLMLMLCASKSHSARPEWLKSTFMYLLHASGHLIIPQTLIRIISGNFRVDYT